MVYGVAWNTDGELSVRHVRLDSLPELKLLNGSKYLQADPGHAYRGHQEGPERGENGPVFRDALPGGGPESLSEKALGQPLHH